MRWPTAISTDRIWLPSLPNTNEKASLKYMIDNNSVVSQWRNNAPGASATQGAMSCVLTTDSTTGGCQIVKQMWD